MNLIFGMVRVFEIAVFALISAGNRLGEAEFSAKQKPANADVAFRRTGFSKRKYFPDANIFKTRTDFSKARAFSKRG
jgi:hypothetical protein